MEWTLCKGCQYHTDKLYISTYYCCEKPDHYILYNEKGCMFESYQLFEHNMHNINFNEKEIDFNFAKSDKRFCPYYMEHEIYDCDNEVLNFVYDALSQ
jgi:hypothetical protein